MAKLGLIVGFLATGSVNIILGLLILIMDRGLAQRTPEDTVSQDPDKQQIMYEPRIVNIARAGI